MIESTRCSSSIGAPGESTGAPSTNSAKLGPGSGAPSTPATGSSTFTKSGRAARAPSASRMRGASSGSTSTIFAPEWSRMYAISCRREPRVDHHQHAAHAQHREVRRQRDRDVGGEHRDAVARLDRRRARARPRSAPPARRTRPRSRACRRRRRRAGPETPARCARSSASGVSASKATGSPGIGMRRQYMQAKRAASRRRAEFGKGRPPGTRAAAELPQRGTTPRRHMGSESPRTLRGDAAAGPPAHGV